MAKPASPTDPLRADALLAGVAAPAAEQLLAAAVAARLHGGAEPLHALRLALRRMRAALAICRPLLSARRYQLLRSDLRWLMAATGPARDWDVLLGETLVPLLPATPEPGQQALLRLAETQRQRARRQAGAALSQPRSRRLLAELELLLAQCRDPSLLPQRRAAAPGGPSLATTVGGLLERRHRQLRRRARDFQQLDGEQRHRLRLRIKGQRYRAELLADFYPGAAASAYVERLKKAQDRLGKAHDLEVAGLLLAGLNCRSELSRRFRDRLREQCVRLAAERQAAQRRPRLGPKRAPRFWR
ncbi:MAG: CHAD domain-containing protein [Stagnimonas sp.]|nr:CHAD domain-containing protein [Stagnimonas sp.]